jgi:hypothetical protein
MRRSQNGIPRTISPAAPSSTFATVDQRSCHEADGGFGSPSRFWSQKSAESTSKNHARRCGTSELRDGAAHIDRFADALIDDAHFAFRERHVLNRFQRSVAA